MSTSIAPLPPRVRGLPLLGNVHQYLRDPLAFLDRAVGEGGDITRIALGTWPFTVVSHPDLAEEVLVTRAKSFSKDRFAHNLKVLLGDGLLISEGDVWRRQRRLANPAFHKERVVRYGEIMVDYAKREVARWRDGEVRDVHKDMMRLTLEIVAKTLFGADVGDRSEVVGESLHAVIDHFAHAEFFFVPALRSLSFIPNVRRFNTAKKNLDDVIHSFVKSRRASERDVESPSSDLLSMLLHARDTDGTGMSDDELRDEIMTIFLAGHETTAIALTFAWMLLAQNPGVEAKLHASLDEALGDRLPGAADMPRLAYANAVIKESMRLYPPAWSIGRAAVEDLTLGGYACPKGTQIWINPWSIHRDPRWFDDPKAFRPERWLEPSIKSLPKYAYFPFGGGPRICIGMGFAEMEAVLLLATMARSAKLRLVSNEKIALLTSITLRPKHGLSARVHTRRGVG